MRTNIEEILNTPYKDNGSYRVPENYFDTLHDRIMNNIAMEEQKSRKKFNIFMMPRMRYMAAACVTGLICGVAAIAFYAHNQEANDAVASIEAQNHEAITEEYVNDCMEYAMVDKEDLYLFIAEE